MSDAVIINEGTTIPVIYTGAPGPGGGVGGGEPGPPGAGVLTPEDSPFNAVGDGVANDTTALQDFFDYLMVNRVPKAVLAGHYLIDPDSIVIDGSADYGNSPDTKEIEWGGAIFQSSGAGDKLISIYQCFSVHFVGVPEFRGTGYTSDTHSLWTTNVGLFLDYCGRSSFDGAYFQGFRYAGIEVESTPGNNNALHLGHIHTKRVASGDSTGSRSLTATFSGASTSGSLGSTAQRSTLTGVSAFPDDYITGADGLPVHQIIVVIAGRPHFVYNLNRAAGTLEIYPRIQASTGTSGSLLYQYGAGLVFLGSDANIHSFTRVSSLSGGCAVEYSSLYGGDSGQVHAESCGSAIRIGATPSSSMAGGQLSHLYCEGSNDFNVLLVTRSATNFKIISRSADQTPSKDIPVHIPLMSGDTYDSIAVSKVGVTEAAYEGWHYPRKLLVLTAEEEIDFNDPATFNGKIFYTQSSGDDAEFDLVAPDAARKLQFGYDAAEITIVGRAVGGAIAGAITFTPPSGHSINGGAADAVLTYPANTFAGPVKLAIVHTAATTWSIYPLPGSPKAVLTESTTARTASATDKGAYIRFTNAGATAFTIPPNSTTAFPIGTEIEGVQAGAGAVTIVAGSGVILNSYGADLVLAGQWAGFTVKKVATNTWDVHGKFA